MEAHNATTEAQTQKEMAALKATDEYKELAETADEAENVPVWEQNMVRNKNEDDGELPPRNPNKNFGTRPMTGQPRTYDSLEKAVQDANKLDDDTEKGFDPIMKVTEAGDTRKVFKVDWMDTAGYKNTVFNRLERNPEQCYVRVAHWFSSKETNKATGETKGFYGELIGETEKAFQFETNGSGYGAGSETFWMPKKAATVCEIELPQ